jgi:hypothetical protein
MKNENDSNDNGKNEINIFIQTLVKKSKDSRLTSDDVLKMLEEKIK